MFDNYRFLSDPLYYLRRQAVSCYLGQSSRYRTDIALAGGSSSIATVVQPFVFDIVVDPGQDPRNKQLRITGSAIPPPASNLNNPKIIGNWIPYLGQTGFEDIRAFGRIKLEDVQSDYVFTYAMNGCSLVIIRGRNTFTHVFHEPTEPQWKKEPNYSGIGNLLYRTSPNYDHPSNPFGGASGLVFLRRWFGQWFIIAQTLGGDGSVLDVDEVRLP